MRLPSLFSRSRVPRKSREGRIGPHHQFLMRGTWTAYVMQQWESAWELDKESLSLSLWFPLPLTGGGKVMLVNPVILRTLELDSNFCELSSNELGLHLSPTWPKRACVELPELRGGPEKFMRILQLFPYSMYKRAVNQNGYSCSWIPISKGKNYPFMLKWQHHM